MRKIIRVYNIVFHWLLPNLGAILSKRASVRSTPVCNQKTRLRGCGRVEIGAKCMFGYKAGGGYYSGCVEIQPRMENSLIKIGENVKTNNNIFICAANYIEIGENTMIGQGVTIMDFESHGTDANKRNVLGEIGKIIIGKNVWIGNSVTILKNSEIGENTIVAAHALVTGKFPPNVVIGGIPAKVIKEL